MSATAWPAPSFVTHHPWFTYIAAWAAAAGMWTIASASSANVSPLETLPYGVLTMTIAGVAGVAVWRMTANVTWTSPRAAFYGAHAAALVLYALVYTTALVAPDIVTGNVTAAWRALTQSPVLWWSVLMGSWLYLTIVGLSYAIRSERARAQAQADAAEAELLARNAQLVALRAQLNPHFLFNALHSVSALVLTDAPAADRALEQLGDLLRYAMQDDELVPLAEEWRFVQDYLAFEQLRLGQRLSFEERITTEAAAQSVPRLLLQPLVENAVRHGIAPRQEAGVVHLAASVTDNVLAISIRNDVDTASPPASRRPGRGLDSVRRRLATTYGERAALQAAVTADGSAFEVCLSIPV